MEEVRRATENIMSRIDEFNANLVRNYPCLVSNLTDVHVVSAQHKQLETEHTVSVDKFMMMMFDSIKSSDGQKECR